jgi:hypothetical protein
LTTSVDVESMPREHAAKHARVHALCTEEHKQKPPDVARTQALFRYSLRCRGREQDCDVAREMATKGCRSKWLGILTDSDMPTVEKVAMSSVPYSVWRHCARGLRATTLRRRIRDWVKFRRWLGEAYKVCWPRRPQDFIDYLDVRRAEPSGHTVPGSCYRALKFMEEAGEVRDLDRLSSDLGLINAVKDLGKRLPRVSDRAQEKEQTPRPLVMVLIAQERCVLDTCPMVYASLRLDEAPPLLGCTVIRRHAMHRWDVFKVAIRLVRVLDEDSDHARSWARGSSSSPFGSPRADRSRTEGG